MQVILLKDVKGTGKKGDVVKVSDGYAANYLIPNKIAIPATNSNLNENKQAKASAEHKKEVEKGQAVLLKNQLDNKVISIKVKCGENGKVFGSVTAKEVADKIKEMGLDVDKRKITMDDIKNFGSYKIEVKLYTNIVAEMTVMVGE